MRRSLFSRSSRGHRSYGSSLSKPTIKAAAATPVPTVHLVAVFWLSPISLMRSPRVLLISVLTDSISVLTVSVRVLLASI